MSTGRYLGERARVAAACLNASFAGPPIIAAGEGEWLVTCAPTAWDGAAGPNTMIWSDATVIAQAELHAASGSLVVPSGLDDLRLVRP